jgi:hypothetical protein
MPMEIRDEVFLKDLEPAQVVALVSADRDKIMITVRVGDIAKNLVTFIAKGSIFSVVLMLFPDGQGRFFDHRGRRIHVHRYE